MGGVALILLSFTFKLGMMPFHTWIYPVYLTLPTSLVFFLSTIVKVGYFFIFVLKIVPMFTGEGSLLSLVSTVCGLSLLCSTLIAISYGTQFVGILAYSGIAHMSICVAIASIGSKGALALSIFYFITYSLAQCIVFKSLSQMSTGHLYGPKHPSRKAVFLPRDIIDFYNRSMLIEAGYARTDLFLLFGFMGIAAFPLTPLFFAKIAAIIILLCSGYTILPLTIIITSILSYYYYIEMCLPFLVIEYFQFIRSEDFLLVKRLYFKQSIWLYILLLLQFLSVIKFKIVLEYIEYFL
jgi:NADH-quinone oxidoreductase subunit N